VAADQPIGDVLDSECFQRCVAETPSEGGFAVPPGGSFDEGSHHRECCQEAMKVVHKRVFGVTACCEGKHIICIFDQRIASDPLFQGQLDPTALQIIRLCVIAHERTHVHQIVCSSEKVPGFQYLTKRYACPGYEKWNRRERESCEAEWRCLNEKRGMCGSNAKCLADVDKMIDNVRRHCLAHGSEISFGQR